MPGEAGRLSDDLTARFSAQSVFMDVNAIEPGRDFRKTIDESVSGCSVLLAVIGPDWLDAKDKSGNRRLDDESDFVRLEIASALRRNIPVIPILVRSATMPLSDQLTPDLCELAYRHAVELTHTRWKSEVQALIQTLEPYAGSSAGAAPSATTPRRYFIGTLAVLIPTVLAILLMPKFPHLKQHPDTQKTNVSGVTKPILTVPQKPNENTQQSPRKPQTYSATGPTRTTPSLASSQTSSLPPGRLDKVTIIHSRDLDEGTFMVDGKSATSSIYASTPNTTVLQLPIGPHALAVTVVGKQCTKRFSVPSSEAVVLECSVPTGGDPQ